MFYVKFSILSFRRDKLPSERAISFDRSVCFSLSREHTKILIDFNFCWNDLFISLLNDSCLRSIPRKTGPNFSFYKSIKLSFTRKKERCNFFSKLRVPSFQRVTDSVKGLKDPVLPLHLIQDLCLNHISCHGTRPTHRSQGSCHDLVY